MYFNSLFLRKEKVKKNATEWFYDHILIKNVITISNCIKASIIKIMVHLASEIPKVRIIHLKSSLLTILFLICFSNFTIISL